MAPSSAGSATPAFRPARPGLTVDYLKIQENNLPITRRSMEHQAVPSPRKGYVPVCDGRFKSQSRLRVELQTIGHGPIRCNAIGHSVCVHGETAGSFNNQAIMFDASAMRRSDQL